MFQETEAQSLREGTPVANPERCSRRYRAPMRDPGENRHGFTLPVLVWELFYSYASINNRLIIWANRLSFNCVSALIKTSKVCTLCYVNWPLEKGSNFFKKKPIQNVFCVKFEKALSDNNTLWGFNAEIMTSDCWMLLTASECRNTLKQYFKCLCSILPSCAGIEWLALFDYTNCKWLL